MYLLSLFVAVLYYINLCYCQISSPNCERQLYNAAELEENSDFIGLVFDLLGDGSTPDPEVESFEVLCFAQGSTMGLYRATSIVVDFRVRPGEAVQQRQCQLLCYNDEWRRPSTDNFEALVGSPPPRYDCRNCRLLDGANHNCQPCDAACNTGLGRCTGPGADDCCSVFFNGTCDTACPANYNATAENNYTCTCSICTDDGFEPNDDCSDCVITDICLANNPCMNGGTCTLNNAPSDYTCMCPSDFTGANCNTTVPTSSSSLLMSPTPTPTPSTCTDNRCNDCPNQRDCCESCSDGYTPINCVCEPDNECTLAGCRVCNRIRDCCDMCNDDYIKDDDDCLCIAPSSTTTGPRETIDRRSGLGTGTLAGIIVAIVLGILVLLTLITLIVYLIYYFVAGAGAAAKTAKGSSPFANGESHDNPLYLRPDEVTSDATLL